MSRRERDLRRMAKEHGDWKVQKAKNGHWLLRHPSGAIASASATPSDVRDLKNLTAALRRGGRHA